MKSLKLKHLIKTTLVAIGVMSSSAVNALQIGSSLPDCKLTDISGQLTDLARLHKGNILYVDFWASWCPPCAKSFPFMNRIISRYSEQDFKIIAVNMDENRADAEAFLQRMPVNFDIVYDIDNQCAESFNVQAMPSSYLIDKDGVIHYIHLGFRGGEADVLEEQINQLLTQPLTKNEQQDVDSLENHKDH